jgi:hypothetical protein
MALNVLAVPLLSWWLFADMLSPTYWIGAGFDFFRYDHHPSGRMM